MIRNAESAIYVGLSTNFRRRLNKHRTGKSIATSAGDLDWRLVNKWEVPDFTSMTRLERYLQHLQSSKGDEALLKFIVDHPSFDSFVKTELAEMDAAPSDLQQFTFPWNTRRMKLNRVSVELEDANVSPVATTQRYIVVDDPASNELARELNAKRAASQKAKKKVSNLLRKKVK